MQDTTIKLTARSVRTLLAGAVIIALVVPVTAAGAEGTPTNSAKRAKLLKEAHDDLKAKKYADAIAKLREAEGISGKTAYDQHLINDMLGFAYARTQNYTEAAKAWEAELDDGFTPQSEIPTRVRQLAEANYQIKNYDKAIEFGNRAIKGGFADEELRTLVGQAYYLKGDWKGTLHFEGNMVDTQVKNGQTPKSESLQLILSACVKLNDSPCETAKKTAATDQANLPKIEKDADAASTGAKNFGVGLAYLGYGQYDKAVDQISKGLTKGGLRNEAEARLLLGIAQLKAGHKEDATKSFHSVKGDPSLERLANLWSLHAKQA